MWAKNRPISKSDPHTIFTSIWLLSKFVEQNIVGISWIKSLNNNENLQTNSFI